MVYELLKDFRKKYKGGIAWRLKAHSKVIEKHLNPGEKILMIFAGQSNGSYFDIFDTSILALTNKRILVAQKRLIPGYVFKAITPDMFNDISIYSKIIWGGVVIDTIKEKVEFTNLPKSSLDYIETSISEFMMEEKKKYKSREASCKKDV